MEKYNPYNVFRIKEEDTYIFKGYRLHKEVKVNRIKLFTKTLQGEYVDVKHHENMVAFCADLKIIDMALKTEDVCQHKLESIYILADGDYKTLKTIKDSPFKWQLINYIDKELSSPFSKFLERLYFFHLKGVHLFNITGCNKLDTHIAKYEFKHDNVIITLAEEVKVDGEPLLEITLPYTWVTFSNRDSTFKAKIPHPFNKDEVIAQIKLNEYKCF